MFLLLLKRVVGAHWTRYLFDWIGCVTWNASTNCCYLFFYLVCWQSCCAATRNRTHSFYARPIAHCQPFVQINGRCLINIYALTWLYEMLMLADKTKNEKKIVVQLRAQFAMCSFPMKLHAPDHETHSYMTKMGRRKQKEKKLKQEYEVANLMLVDVEMSLKIYCRVLNK